MSETLSRLARKAYSVARQNSLLKRLVRVPGMRRIAVACRDGLKAGLRSYRSGGLPCAISLSPIPEPESAEIRQLEALSAAPPPQQPVLTAYEQWIGPHQKVRSQQYPYRPEPRLLSFFSPAWNTPVHYFRELYHSLDQQTGQIPFEWLILDNGSDAPETLAFLAELSQVPWVRVIRVAPNIGIGRAMRKGLEEARGKYLLPVDSDDLMFPDAARIMTSMIQQYNYPEFLYSDEDHLNGDRLTVPYFKPDWDPVLGVNSAYTAHLEALHRETALRLNCYPGSQVDGSTDWDTTLRMAAAGCRLVHVPEMLYHWREHANSTAADISCKSYIFDSQTAVLTHWLAQQPVADRFELQKSPFFGGTPDWWVRRREVEPEPVVVIRLQHPAAGEMSPVGGEQALRAGTNYPLLDVINGSARWTAAELGRLVERIPQDCRRVVLVSSEVSITRPDWLWEAIGLFELFPDLVQVGGRVHNASGAVVDCGRVLGFGDDLLGCPDRGRMMHDCGYYAQMFKPHSVDGMSTRLAMFDRAFLESLLHSAEAKWQSLYLLGHWAAAAARRQQRRVVYTPFMAGQDWHEWQELARDEERNLFARQAGDLLSGSPNYPAVFGLTPETAYTPIAPAVRQAQVARWQIPQQKAA